MLVSEALSCLGSKRTIWIDDQFNEAPPEKLADLLLNRWEVAVQCNLDELKVILPKAEYGVDAVRVELVEKLTELTPRRRNEMQAAVLVRETMEGAISSRELSEPTIEKICTLLRVHTDDRWTFDNAEGGLVRLCADGDADVSYIVDLNDAAGSATRGLGDTKAASEREIKRHCLYILTHDAAKGEQTKEAELRGSGRRKNESGISDLVIAKQRLFELEDDRDLEETLRISIKRAGLRRSLSEVVSRAPEYGVHAAFGTAAAGLLHVPPNNLKRTYSSVDIKKVSRSFTSSSECSRRTLLRSSECFSVPTGM